MEFARLGEVRSLILKCVNILAFTATTTKSTRKVVIKLLNMKNPSIISIPPNKDMLSIQYLKRTVWKMLLKRSRIELFQKA